MVVYPDAKNQLFNTIILSVTSMCNLRCTYCQTGPYMKRAAFSTMPMKLLARIVAELAEAMTRRSQQKIEFCFSGGEPLLAGLDFFRDCLAVQEEYMGSASIEVRNTVQTNGTLLSPSWAAFFRDNSFGLSVSLDGPQSVHDGQRPTLSGGGSFSQVMKGLDVLRAHDVRFGLITVVTETSATEIDAIVRFLFSHSPQLIAFLPCADRGRPISSGTWGECMTRAFDLWIDPSVNSSSIPIRTFRDVCLHAFGMPISKACDYSANCPRHPNIAPDGLVSVCDQFVGKPQGVLGDARIDSLSSIFASRVATEFATLTKTLPEGCTECSYLSLCNGGCPYRRIQNGGVDYLCGGRKRLFSHILDRVQRIVGATSAAECFVGTGDGLSPKEINVRR